MSSTMEQPQSVKVSRVVNLFDVPPKLADQTGVHQVGLYTLTGEEELLCFKKAKGEQAKLATELAKTALVEADGAKLAVADGTVDTFWKGLDPRVRQLVMTAYAELHAAQEDDTDSFLKSRKVRVG